MFVTKKKNDMRLEMNEFQVYLVSYNSSFFVKLRIFS